MPGHTLNTLGPRSAIAVLLVAVSLMAVPGATQPAPAVDTASPADVPLVEVTENSSERLWPYTSRQPSHHTATLPINVVVANHPAFVRFLLSRSAGAEWNVTEYQVEEQQPNATEENGSTRVESGVVVNGTRLEWTGAEGSNRYTYLHDTDTGEGRWVGETYQLHRGNYLGSRYHVRMYKGGSGSDTWTAIQVHREHWDWFRLRHTVDSVDRAQDYLESEFRSSGVRQDIRRSWYANGGALDSDGWVTWIEVDLTVLGPMLLTGLALASGLVAGMTVDVDVGRIRGALRGRLESGTTGPEYLLLSSSLGLLVLGVRVVAISVETTAPGLSPKVIAGVFYPILVVGTPACAVFLARGLDPSRSAIAAAVGFGAGVIADYLYIGVAVVPVGVLVHRAALLSAVAVLAAGGANRSTDAPLGARVPTNRLVALGGLAWIVALLLPVLDVI